MQLSAAVLAALISQCAPDVSPDTMNALNQGLIHM